MAALTVPLTILFLLFNITNMETKPNNPTFNLNELGKTLNHHSMQKRSLIDKKYCKEGEVFFSEVKGCKPCNEIKKFCRPICRPFCKTCGICDCDQGFILHLANNSRQCIPQCLKGCQHGDCIAPENCQCHPGYSNHERKCQPICEKPCVNGTCISPEACECLPGYIELNRNTCKPYCSNGCANGSCIAPETCICNKGWLIEEAGCIPVCGIGCGNGTCMAPNTCICDPGFKLNDNDNIGTESLMCVEMSNVSSDDTSNSSKYWIWIYVAVSFLIT